VSSLVCEYCDTGDNIGSHEEAIAAGWSDIQYAPDLPMANSVGLCPACRAFEEGGAADGDSLCAIVSLPLGS